MRNIINISMPDNLVKIVRNEIREGNFASTSEFFRHLVRLWNTEKTLKDLEVSKKDFEKGRYKVLKSLDDLD